MIFSAFLGLKNWINESRVKLSYEFDSHLNSFHYFDKLKGSKKGKRKFKGTDLFFISLAR